MEKIHFYNTTSLYEGKTDFVKKNIMVINFTGLVPTADEIANGFEILNENNSFIQAEYPSFNTVYRIYEDCPNKIEISNDGSVYKEPEPIPEPKPYVPTLEEVKASKIQELSITCNRAIITGVEVNIDEVNEHFSYTDEDQVNIKEIFDLAMQTQTPMYYHADNKSCKLYTVEQITNIYATLALNKMHNITYFNQLKLYVQSLGNEEDVNNVMYGQELTGEYFDVYNAAMAQAKIGMNSLFGITEQDAE